MGELEKYVKIAYMYAICMVSAIGIIVSLFAPLALILIHMNFWLLLLYVFVPAIVGICMYGIEYTMNYLWGV